MTTLLLYTFTFIVVCNYALLYNKYQGIKQYADILEEGFTPDLSDEEHLLLKFHKLVKCQDCNKTYLVARMGSFAADQQHAIHAAECLANRAKE